jgi:hypothetical protein
LLVYVTHNPFLSLSKNFWKDELFFALQNFNLKLFHNYISLSLIAVTKAIPFPIEIDSSTMPDIAAIMSVNPYSFPSYQTGGLVRANSTTTPSNPIVSRDCPKGRSGDGNCCATQPILTWVSNTSSNILTTKTD